MFLGIAVGRLLRRSRVIAFSDKAVTVVIAVMLLVMGWDVGARPSVVSGLSGYGITALLLAVAGAALWQTIMSICRSKKVRSSVWQVWQAACSVRFCFISSA